jgi:CAAX prenyl protease-like protein
VVWLVFRVVGSVVTVPLAEELAFRGYLPRRLQAADFEAVPLGRFTGLSFLASSVLFGLLHGRWLAGTLAGMFYALALYRRRDLAEPVLAHAVTNALIAAHVLATGNWSLWA